MSSLNTLTGRQGRFQVESAQVARTTNWAVSDKLASSNAWGDSDSGGWTNRSPGRMDRTFNAEGKYDTTDEAWDLFNPGDILVAVLWINNSTLYWDFPRAMNESFDMAVNIDTEEVIGWTSSWGTDGQCFYPGESGATSRTLPAS